MLMLTDKQEHDVRSRLKMFRSNIYLNTYSRSVMSHAVESGIDEYIAGWQQQGSLLASNTQGVTLSPMFSRRTSVFGAVAPANVASYD